MSIVILNSKDQLEHVATAVMTGIHDVFPTNIIDSDNPILEKKLLIGEGQYSFVKTLLGFDFDGNCITMWLEEGKRAKLLTKLHSWIQADSLKWGVPFQELESMAAKVRHAFMALPGGQCLLSPCNQLLKRRPQEVYFHQNKPLILAIGDGRWELTGSSLGAQWELSGSSLGALWELVAVAGIFFMRLQSDQVIVLSAWDAM
jgi:hypothetical protein